MDLPQACGALQDRNIQAVLGQNTQSNLVYMGACYYSGDYYCPEVSIFLFSCGLGDVTSAEAVGSAKRSRAAPKSDPNALSEQA